MSIGSEVTVLALVFRTSLALSAELMELCNGRILPFFKAYVRHIVQETLSRESIHYSAQVDALSTSTLVQHSKCHFSN